ncbi:MAG: MATE family efflux transporter [Rhizobiaceae bacterium]|nr:MATE family efflux transporter [Rhizobiaceae bacterium]
MSMTDAAALAPATLWRDEIRAMLRLAWPMVLTNLAQTAMTATDVMIIGRLGADALAASALGVNIYYTPMIFGLGLMLATSPMLAVELGRRRHSVRDLRRTVRQGFWIAIMAAIPIWAILWNTDDILIAMGQDPALAEQAGIYIRALQWSLLPFYLYIVLRSFISALERPRWALVVAFTAVAVNAIGNYLLVYGSFGFPRLGLAGSGIATTFASGLMFVGLAIVVTLDPKFRRYRLFGRVWRADWPRFRGLLRLGLPIAGILLFEVALFNGATLLMGLIDTASIAAYQIAIQIGSIAFMVPMGLGQAATVRVGLAFGAGDREGIRRAGWTAFVLAMCFMSCTALMMISVPHALISGFIDLTDPANDTVVGLAVTFLAFAALFQLADGGQAVGIGMLRGLQDTTVPMAFAGIGYWLVGMPVGVALAFWAGLDGSGIWIGLSTGLAVVAVLVMSRWIRRERLGLLPPAS